VTIVTVFRNGVGRCLIQISIDKPTCLIDSQNGSRLLEIS